MVGPRRILVGFCFIIAPARSGRSFMEAEMEEKVILAYVSQYKNKYYFNQDIGKLPDAVKNEILSGMIFITEEAGGVTELGFEPDGTVYLDTYAEEDDLGYDQISGRLLISEFEREHKELFDQLKTWFRTVKRGGLS